MRSLGVFGLLGVAVSQDVFLSNGPSQNDLTRAVSKPRNQFRGDGYERMNAVLNKHLLSSGKTMRACENFTLAELHSVRAVLFDAREPALDDVYRPNSDGRVMTIESKEELAQQNDHHKEIVAQHPTLIQMMRDGLCHETIMWFEHHLTEAARKKLDVVLPALPVSEKHSLHSANPTGLEDKVAKVYDQQLNCQSCHTFNTILKGASWPDWPEELSFTAKGYGPFPFFPAASGATRGSTSVFKGWYSRKQMYQRIYHSECDLSQSHGPSSGECNELFTSGGDVHISTASSCCKAITGPNLHKMPVFAQDFYKTMSGPTKVQYSGAYYSGEAYFYYATIPISSTQWYYTKLDGTPLELGEGPLTSSPQTRCDPYATRGVWCVYHQYDPSSFDFSAIDSSIFADPSICSGVSTECTPRRPPR
jgi:hypothetical protein